MKWQVKFHPIFETEFDELSQEVQDELLAKVVILSKLGPELGRPTVDQLKGSRYSNLKELRFQADDGVWRVAFAFDIERQAILLVAGDKSGISQKKFYKALIRKADERFDQHLQQLKENQ
jgi:hypothetical protein